MRIGPYFLTNKEWYEEVIVLPEDVETLEEAITKYKGTTINDYQVWKLTDKGKSISEVVKSYEDWNKESKNLEEISKEYRILF